MGELRVIDPKPFIATLGELPPLNEGRQPYLEWLAISNLFIDPSYQREIGERGRKNILRIAREFEWARFATVVVSPLGQGRYAIIDGQHRTTAAALRGIIKVPCQIIIADVALQAAAFAAINANITEMSPMQVHAAKIAARDPAALRLAKVCEAAGVTICRYKIGSTYMKPGETLAVVQIRNALDRFGEDILKAALSVIAKTGDGNANMVRGQLVHAVCSVLQERVKWLGNPALIARFEKFDFRAAWSIAAKEASMSRGKIITVLTREISNFLDAASPAPAPSPRPAAPQAQKPIASPPQTMPTASKPTNLGASQALISRNGIVVVLGSKPGVTRDGIFLPLPVRHCEIVAALIKVMPAMTGRQWLINIALRDIAKSDREPMLDEIFRDLARSLPAINLEFKHVKGAGAMIIQTMGASHGR